MWSGSMVGERVGKYTVVRKLGEGGMGVVYEAVREDIGSKAAIKVLRPECAGNAEIAGRFFNEARAANLIQNPAIVQIFDYGHLPDGAAYLAMELLKGESLRARLNREEVLSEEDTLWITRQIASGLAEAHAQQVIHRDLKPENVMLIPDPEAPSGERAKILDFGIAKLLSPIEPSFRTDTRALMGTPIYMSPEQCRGLRDIDAHADVYSLGVMIFEMLAGRPPFVADLPMEVMAMHLSTAPEALTKLVPGLSAGMDRLVMAMLAKKPELRPTMDAVVRSLKDLRGWSSDSLQGRRRPEPAVAPGAKTVISDNPAIVGAPGSLPRQALVASPQAVTVALPSPLPGAATHNLREAAARPSFWLALLAALIIVISLLAWWR